MKQFWVAMGLWMSLSMLMVNASHAVEVEGVQIADTATVAGEALILNGAGVRTKFFFDIYIGALYLPSKVTSAQDVLKSKGNKRVVMHILYDEVPRDKLVAGWSEGFEKNSRENLNALQARLNQFNNFFQDMTKDDTVVYDFTAKGNTNVTINDKAVGSIEGIDFQQALLAVWLGNEPADDDLKEAMMGAD